MDSNVANLKIVGAESRPEEVVPKAGFRKWAPLIVLSLALAIVILDTTILNVSLRVIINDLHTDIENIQWVITAYSLILAAFTITGGRLGDLFGRKKMFVLGAVIFAVGSFVASISKNVGMMIAGEAIIEGIGAALMMPATASLLVSNYKGRDRAIAFGVWGGIAGAAAALGPISGGYLATNYTWRWAFRINVFVAAMLVLGSFLIKEFKDKEEKPGLDFGGIILSALGLLSIVFGFIKATDYGWLKAKAPMVLFGHQLNLGSLSVVPLFIGLGIIIMGFFLFWEKRMAKKCKTPLVSLRLFKNKQFTIGASTSAILALGQAGLIFSVPVFFQAVKGLDAFHTGIAMLPMSITLLVAAPLSALISKYLSPKSIIQIGLAISVASFFVLRMGINPSYSQWALSPGFILFGLGMGLMMAQASNITLSAVSVQESGEASGVNNTFRQVGSTLGSAILGAVLLSTLATNVSTGISQSTVIPDNLKPKIESAVAAQSSNIEFSSGPAAGSVNLPESIKNEITRIKNDAIAKSNKTALAYGSIFIILGFIISFWLPKGRDVETEQSVAEPENSELVPVKKARASAMVFALLMAIIAGISGFYIGKNKYDRQDQRQNSQPAVLGQNITNSNTDPVQPRGQQPAAPAQQTPAQDNRETAYNNTDMHFSLMLPSGYKVEKTTGSEADIISQDKSRYSVQVYNANSGDGQALKDFLSAQKDLHNVSEAKVGNQDAFRFQIDGTYKQGYAFLANGRLYYLLGPESSDQPLWASFTAL